MRFFKGMVVGTMLSAGIMMIYLDSDKATKKKWIKHGKNLMKKMECSC